MEFGLKIRSAVTFDAMKELTLYAEKNDYFGVFINDHVHGFKSKGNEPYLESWTVLSALASITSKIRLGQAVLFNSLRNPAFLAKSVSTLDVISEGRYELLLGAGWNVPEYEGYDLMEQGKGMPSAKERVDRLKEALQILRLMLNNDITNFDGKFWKLKDAINNPQPIQKNMRISVGGSKDRMIKISAKYADGINVGDGYTKVKSVLEKLQFSLEKNNKTLDSYFVSGSGTVTIAKDDQEYKLLVEDMAKRTGKLVEEIKKEYLIGTPEILREKISNLEKIGMKLYIMSIQPASSFDDMLSRYELFTKEVKQYFH